jgi:hypothetical protein
MKTDTPETDAETWKAGDLRIGSKVCADFARKLERERDELKRWTSVNGVIDLQRERDEAREYADKLAEGLPDGMLPKDVEVLREANLGLATELATVTEQRDRLAEVINAATILIAAKGRHNTVLAYEGLREALQSLTPNAEP